MSIGVALLCSVCSSDFIHPFKHGHHDLLVELWTLSQIYLTAEILHLEYFRSSFRRESDDLRRVDLSESIVIEKPSHDLFHECSYLECLHISRMSQDDNLIIVDSLSIGMNLIFGDIYRTRINDFPDHIHHRLLQFETEFSLRHLCNRSCSSQNGSHQTAIEFFYLLGIFNDYLCQSISISQNKKSQVGRNSANRM